MLSIIISTTNIRAIDTIQPMQSCWFLSFDPACYVQAFMPRLLHRCGVECFVTGNYSHAETLQLGQHVERILKVFAALPCPCYALLFCPACHHPKLAALPCPCCAVLCCAVPCRAKVS